MKKLLLTVILSVAFLQSPAVIRTKNFNPALGTLTIQNFANFVYNYSQFQISIGNNYYTLAALSYTGNLNMLALAYVYFYSLSLPANMIAQQDMLSGTSIALWYPNSLPGNATPSNLVDFLQYGSAGNPYESVAVAAGLWTAGDFISVPPPYQFNGAINDYGSSFFSTTTSIDKLNGSDFELQILPNPVSSTAKLIMPADFNKSNSPLDVVVFNVKGEAVIRKMINGSEEYLLDCSNLPEGHYSVQIINDRLKYITRQVVKVE